MRQGASRSIAMTVPLAAVLFMTAGAAAGQPLQRLCVPQAPSSPVLTPNERGECPRFFGVTYKLEESAAAGAGATGPTGPEGKPGPTGATGSTGAAGANGANGTNGQPGLPGATGPTGAAGLNGGTGAAGATGATGPAGSQGAEGATGASGAPGAAGLNGATGATGEAGPTGVQGAAGPTGATGSTGATAGGIGVTVATKEASVPPLSLANVNVGCPANDVATGGGAVPTVFTIGSALAGSFPTGFGGFLSSGGVPTGWAASYVNDTSETASVDIWVICAPA